LSVRAFAWFVALLLSTLLVSAVIAYPLFELVAPLGDWPFHRVASRIAMIVVAVELVWLCRHLNLRSRRDFGYGLPWRKFVRQSAWWALAGVATASVGAAFLLAAKLRVAEPQFVPTASTLAHMALVGVGSGIAVALIEETVMRGAMHTAIERESGPWAAALLTALLFSLTHLFAKAHIPPEELAWRSGFDLLLRSFAPLSHFTTILDSLLSWLVVGLILSLTRVLTGNIAVAVGLHAGWVVVLRMLQQGTVLHAGTPFSPWVGSFDGLVGYWMLPWGACVGIGLWGLRARWVPAARSL